MAALPGLASLVAHGGIGGAIVELLLVLSIAGVFLAVWLRERRSRSHDLGDDDQSKPQ